MARNRWEFEIAGPFGRDMIFQVTSPKNTGLVFFGRIISKISNQILVNYHQKLRHIPNWTLDDFHILNPKFHEYPTFLTAKARQVTEIPEWRTEIVRTRLQDYNQHPKSALDFEDVMYDIEVELNFQ